MKNEHIAQYSNIHEISQKIVYKKIVVNTLNYRITVPVLLIFPGQNTLWYSNFFVVLLFIPMKMLLRYFYLLWYFY